MNIFNLTASLTLDKSQYEKGIEDAKGKGEEFSKKTEKNIGIISANAWLELGKKVISAGQKIAQVTLDLVNYADKYDDLSARYDMTTASLQEFDYVASQTGATLDGVMGAMTIMYNKAKENDEAFSRLGVSVYDVNGNMKSMDTLFWEVKNSLDNVQNSGDKSALMLDVFGRSAMNLGEFLRKDTGELEAMAQEAHDLGIILSEETTSRAGEFNDVLASLKLQGKSAFTELLAGTEGSMVKVDDFFDKLTEAIDKYAPTFFSFIVKLLGKLIVAISKVLPNLVGTLIDAIFEIDWFQVGVNIMIAIGRGILSIFTNILKRIVGLFGGNTSAFEIGSNFNNESANLDAGFDDSNIMEQNNYSVTERQSSTMEIKLSATGTSEIDEENAEKIASKLVPIIDKKMGGI